MRKVRKVQRRPMMKCVETKVTGLKSTGLFVFWNFSDTGHQIFKILLKNGFATYL